MVIILFKKRKQKQERVLSTDLLYAHIVYDVETL